jgi:hypothetical protein
MTLSVAVLAVAGTEAAVAAPVQVTFGGTINIFNPGPLPAGEPFSGSFLIDTSVPPSGTSIIDWIGAVQDFVFQAGSLTFTGSGGNHRQFNNQFITGTFNTAGAVLSGVVPDTDPFVLTNVTWDWRTSFSPNDVVVSGLTRDDFNFTRLTLDFSHPTAALIDRTSILTLQTLTFAVVPLPAAAWLLGPAVAGLAAFGRRRRA